MGAVSETLDQLRSMFPGKLMLTVEDVARVLGLREDRAGREAVTAALRNGTLLPGLRKVMGRWRVPIVSLARWLDGLNTVQADASQAGGARRTRLLERSGTVSVPARGRQPDMVRNAARETRAKSFFGELLTRLDNAGISSALPSGKPSGGRSTL